MQGITNYNNAFQAICDNTDILADFIRDKRAVTTKTEYGKDLRDFFKTMTGQDPTPKLVVDFLSLTQRDAIAVVLTYKAKLQERGLKESTINRRLAAIKSLVEFANRIEKCSYSLQKIKGDKVIPYRDTTGVSADAIKKMLAIPNRDTLKGKRDYAILRLLWDNALRRSEVVGIDTKDLDLEMGKLWIIGKGKGTQKEDISLSPSTVKALQDWVDARGELNINQPLFIALDRSSYGHRMSDKSVYNLVKDTAKAVGISKPLSPHRIRHSAITTALDATGGDMRRVQRLSRHAKFDTLKIYDDNRQNLQGEITDLLADLV
jgi:integrase/recombinase XerC